MDWSTGKFFTETIVRLDNEPNFGGKFQWRLRDLVKIEIK